MPGFPSASLHAAMPVFEGCRALLAHPRPVAYKRRLAASYSPHSKQDLLAQLRNASSESSGAMVLRLLEHAREFAEAWEHVPWSKMFAMRRKQ